MPRPGQPLLHTSNVAATAEAILGANLVDVWYAADAQLVSNEVASVTGRKTGLTMSARSAGQRPSYTANNAGFVGAPPTVNTARDAGRCLVGAPPGGALPAGSRPFAWVIGRTPTVRSAAALGVIIASGSGNYASRIQLVDTSWSHFVWFSGAVHNALATPNNAPHLFGTYRSGTTGQALYIDDVLHGTQAAATAGTDADSASMIALGGNGVHDAEGEGVEAVMWGLCKSPPTSAELTALHNLAKTYGVT